MQRRRRVAAACHFYGLISVTMIGEIPGIVVIGQCRLIVARARVCHRDVNL